MVPGDVEKSQSSTRAELNRQHSELIPTQPEFLQLAKLGDLLGQMTGAESRVKCPYMVITWRSPGTDAGGGSGLK
jgi:hypothetical protein